MMNILLALRAREATAGLLHRRGDGGQPVPARVLGAGKRFRWGEVANAGRRPGDGRHAALPGLPHAGWPLPGCAPLEQKFWENFLQRAGSAAPAGRRGRSAWHARGRAEIIASRTADEWLQRFAGVDACVSVVKSLQEAVDTPHFRERGLFQARVRSDSGHEIPALPLPIAPALRDQHVRAHPGLGEANTNA
jgi:alpha-methylacyl-CoA racemase